MEGERSFVLLLKIFKIESYIIGSLADVSPVALVQIQGRRHIQDLVLV
jgi:hypothetical protein